MSDETLSNRKPLRKMTFVERAKWYLEQRAELEDFCGYAQTWTREDRGVAHERTMTSDMNSFLRWQPIYSWVWMSCTRKRWSRRISSRKVSNENCGVWAA